MNNFVQESQTFQLFQDTYLEGLLCDESSNDSESTLREDKGLEYECAQQEKSPRPIMTLCSIPFQVLTLGCERLNNENTSKKL
jgi:hypothetical protein